jgi:trimeric autotransporter adhesin
MKFSIRRPSAIVAAGVLALAGALVQAPQSSADVIGGSSAVITGPTTGVVGVPMTMAIQVTDSWTPGVSLTLTPQGSNSGGAAPITISNIVSGQTQNFTFVPPHVGSFTFTSPNVTSLSAPTIQVQPVSVNVNIKAPNTLRVGQAATISATVTPTQGVLSPVGQIQFAIVGSGNVGGPVWLNQGSPSTASISWTPGSVGSVQFTATFIPNRINGFPDTSCVNSNCTSAVDTIQITNTGVNVFLTNPPQFFAGVPNTITAQVSVVPPTGGVSFFVNGQAFASNVPVQSNGQASASWTPAAPGTFTISANWTGSNGVTGGSQETVNVSAGTGQVDGIVLTPAGQASWAPGGTYQVANGTTLNFTAKTSSGAQATISDTGPCQINGMSLTAAQGSGGCILTASSPGGNGYGPSSQSYTIQLIPGNQALTFQPRASGPVNRGRTIRLEARGGSDTTAGEPLKWRVVRGANVCQLRFQANGGVTLRTVRNGDCRVRATAPAIAGQWNALSQNFNYRVR